MSQPRSKASDPWQTSMRCRKCGHPGVEIYETDDWLQHRTSYKAFDKWTAHNFGFNRHSELLERPFCPECRSGDLDTTGLLPPA
jgi:hypothetical protein